MNSVKTAISIQSSLFKEVDSVCRQLGISRSQLFAVAAEDFIRRHRNRRLLEQINRAYSETDQKEERNLLDAIKRKQRKIAEGEW